MKIHDLKIVPQDFIAVKEGVKNFEIRKNDCNFQKDDLVLLKEYKNGEYTGLEVLRQVTYITDYLQKDGFVVMSLKAVPISFQSYIRMSDKEKSIFETVLTHANLSNLARGLLQNLRFSGR